MTDASRGIDVGRKPVAKPTKIARILPIANVAMLYRKWGSFTQFPSAVYTRVLGVILETLSTLSLPGLCLGNASVLLEARVVMQYLIGLLLVPSTLIAFPEAKS